MEDVDEEGAADDDSWRLLRLVYAHLPPSERHRVEYARKRRAPPKACAPGGHHTEFLPGDARLRDPLQRAHLPGGLGRRGRSGVLFLLNEYGWGF